jgi:hypothetical protein
MYHATNCIAYALVETTYGMTINVAIRGYYF